MRTKRSSKLKKCVSYFLVVGDYAQHEEGGREEGELKSIG